MALLFYGPRINFKIVPYHIKHSMTHSYPTPWNFANTDANLISPNQHYQVEFGPLYEIAMGAPLGGCCYLLVEDQRIKLHDWVGGPIIWEETGNKLALPLWTKQRQQQLAIFDPSTFTLTTFQRIYRVLHLTSFSTNQISGIDSPIYQPITVQLNLDTERIDSTKSIKR